MRKRPALAKGLAVVLAALVLSGCSAARYTSTLKPPDDKDLEFGSVRFAMSSFTYERLGVQPSPRLINERARALYPSMFTDDRAGLPVHIDFKRSDSSLSDGSKILLMIVTLFGVVPIPHTDRHDFTVRVGVLDSLGETLCEKEETFEIDVNAWISYWPLGLLPIPGRSDLPREYRVGDLVEWGPASINKVNNHAAECIAGVVVQALKSADQAKLRAAFQERKSRVQEIIVDGKPYKSFLTMAGVSKPKPGSTFNLLVYQDDVSYSAKPMDQAVVARMDESGNWRPVRSYLRSARTLTLVSVLIENNVPVRAVVRTPDTPPLEDFIDTPDLSGSDRAEILRWSNGVLLEAKNRSLENVLKQESRDTLLSLATRIEKSILDLSAQAERAKDRAQTMVEQDQGDPAPDRELSILCRQRIEILKPVLAAVKYAATGK